MREQLLKARWLCSLLDTSLFADVPIMNMMPCWSGGWGYQFIQEFRRESALLLGDNEEYPGFTEDVHLLHLRDSRWELLDTKANISLPKP